MTVTIIAVMPNGWAASGAMTPSFELENPQKLRELATWYRDYAERAGTPWVRERRFANCRGARAPGGDVGGQPPNSLKPRGSRSRDEPCPRTASVVYSIDPL